MAVNSAAAARELGAQLRAWRKAAGLTTRVLAGRIGVSAANISHWETGSREPSVERLTAYLDALSIAGDDRERVLNLHHSRSAAEPARFAASDISPQLTELVDYEQLSQRILQWSPLIIPGLLQTGDYARAIFGQGPNTATKVAIRAGRREILTRKRPPATFSALVDSTVLSRPIGTPAVMRDQLEFLLEMAALPNVSIRIVPAATPGFHSGLAGGFIVLEFPVAPPVVHFEHHTASWSLTDDEDVIAYQDVFGDLEAMALTEDQSMAFIKDTLHEWEQS